MSGTGQKQKPYERAIKTWQKYSNVFPQYILPAYSNVKPRDFLSQCLPIYLSLIALDGLFHALSNPFLNPFLILASQTTHGDNFPT